MKMTIFRYFSIHAFVFLASVNLHAFSPTVRSDGIPPVELTKAHRHLESPKYCGIASVYMLSKLFNQEIPLEELLQAFPHVEEKGMSLKQIQNFLEKRGYYCKLEKLNDTAFIADYPTAKMIVLQETKDDLHLYIKHLAEPGVIQILDPSGETKTMGKGIFSEIPAVSLIVSKEQITDKITPYLVATYLLPAFIGGLCIVFLLNVFQRRARPHSSTLVLFFMLVGIVPLPSQELPAGVDSDGQDKIVSCENPFFDAGIVKTGTGEALIEHAFTLKNNGQKPLKIIDLVASCTCTDVSAEKAVLAPGGETRILASMTLSSSLFAGRKAEIIVLFEDPEKRQITKKLSLFAKAEYAAYIKPELIDFGTVAPNDTSPKYRTFFVCSPSQSDNRDFIQAIESKFPDSVMFKVESQTKESRKTAKGENYYFYTASVHVLLKKYEEHFLDSPVGIVKIKDGQELPVRIGARIVNLPVFSPHKARLSKKAPGNTMQIMYNSASGGIPISAHVTGKGVLIKEVRKLLPYYVYVIAHEPVVNTQSPETKEKHALIIKIEGGNEQTLAIEIEEESDGQKEGGAQ